MLVFAGVAALSGCGFVHAGGVSHVKPDGFVLRGRVSVGLPTDDPRTSGAACASGYPDVVAGAPVRVTGPHGSPIADGSLGAGVVARVDDHGTCDFPFQIAGVPGGVASYGIAVGDRLPQTFPALALRHDKPAVITLSPAPRH